MDFCFVDERDTVTIGVCCGGVVVPSFQCKEQEVASTMTATKDAGTSASMESAPVKSNWQHVYEAHVTLDLLRTQV